MNSQLHVLIVEDDADVAMACEQALQLEGYECGCMSSAEMAQKHLSADFAGVVVSDIRLPRMSGLELQRRCRHLSLADVFRLEYDAACGCAVHTDFAEGVRALLIDKDKAPRWQPATLAAVTPAWVAEHLKPRHTGAHPLADLA